MLKYLVIVLDDAAPSYCSYSVTPKNSVLDIDVLRDVIKWAMKENLQIQMVYREDCLTPEIQDALNQYDYCSISRKGTGRKNDIICINEWSFPEESLMENAIYVIRTSKSSFFEKYHKLKSLFCHASKVNVVFTDIETFTDEDLTHYESCLMELSDEICRMYQQGKKANFNLLTDRLFLNHRNSCNAGIESIALMPDGQFYICPGFYYDGESSIGNPSVGVKIKNLYLLVEDNSPICRICNAYQCKRCVWENKRLTREINIPSSQQCKLSHIEQRCSRVLKSKLEEYYVLKSACDIPDNEYLDPFELLK